MSNPFNLLATIRNLQRRNEALERFAEDMRVINNRLRTELMEISLSRLNAALTPSPAPAPYATPDTTPDEDTVL
jgi:hypothetical protein